MKKLFLYFAIFLLALNIFAWQEVFYLEKPQNLRVDFLDVGQGDSAFIRTPGNHHILIDGGPTSAVLQKLAERMPFWDKDLDLVILTHPEKDHMQGLIDVLQRYKADYILWSGVKKSDAEYIAWEEALAKQKNMGAKIIIARVGQEIKAGNVLIDTLYPIEGIEGKELKNTSNDASVVSKLIFGKNSFLFTGDISSKAEKEISNIKENVLADVLKVAHHGSKYSTTDLFLASIMPKIAVISVGAKNSYGHPTKEVLQRLEKFGIKVERTDIDGDIEVMSDGNNITINSQLKK